MKKTQGPYVLYRYHGFGDVNIVSPIVTKYKTVEEYDRAVIYNVLNRPLHALFSAHEILNQGGMPTHQTHNLLINIKKGKYPVPSQFNNINNLHTI